MSHTMSPGGAPTPGSPLSPAKLAVHRPSLASRSATAPEKMAVNGHFASVGQNGHANFEHGVQVIDEDKEFKYVLLKLLERLWLTYVPVRILETT